MTTPAPSTPPDHSTEDKSMLHCPTCGHESPADGDWQVESETAADQPDHEQISYTCPECNVVVTTRFRRRAMVA